MYSVANCYVEHCLNNNILRTSTVECIDVAHIKVREAGSLSKSGNCHVAVFGLNGGKAILREGVVLIVHYGVKVIGYPLGGGQHLADGIKVWLVACELGTHKKHYYYASIFIPCVLT